MLSKIQDVARETNLSVTFIRRELQRNPNFPRIKAGRVFRFSIPDVIEYLKQQSQPNGKEQEK